MSREIKFRAWNLEKGIMCYDNEDMSVEYWDGVYSSEVGLINNYLNLPEHLRAYEYMQYIGLHDKNRKEMCESDICIVTTSNIDEEDGYFVVEWDNDGARFILNGDGLTIDFDNVCKYEVEVIGNIYENSDLLEVD